MIYPNIFNNNINNYICNYINKSIDLFTAILYTWNNTAGPKKLRLKVNLLVI
jgi:hypothetical protein